MDSPSNKIRRGRLAAKQAALKVTEQLVSSDSEGDRPRRKSKAPSKNAPVSFGTSTPSTRPLKRPTRSQSRPKYVGKKRPLTPESSGSDVDNSTLLSSPLSSPSLSSPRRPVSRVSNELSLCKPARPRTLSAVTKLPSSFTDEAWERDKLGTYVWVLLDQKGRAVTLGGVNDLERDQPARMWWPSKVSFSSNEGKGELTWLFIAI